MATAIDDGYTLDFYLKGVPGLYPDLRGERRPTLVRERNAAQKHAFRAEGDTDRTLKSLQEFCAKKLVSWSATSQHTVTGKKSWDDDTSNVSGDTLPITAASLALLEPELWDHLSNVLMGYRAGDKPPESAQPELSGDEQYEADRKNS